MGLSYDDLSLLRFIQKRQSIPLPKVAMQFEKNEISIRRAIEQINLYSAAPMIEIKKGWCLSRVSYKEFVDFIKGISMEDYASSWAERIRVVIVTIFFQGYVNASSLYESWGLSLPTKKQDTANLRRLLSDHGLQLVTLKKKGLSIEGTSCSCGFLSSTFSIPCWNLRTRTASRPASPTRPWKSRATTRPRTVCKRPPKAR